MDFKGLGKLAQKAAMTPDIEERRFFILKVIGVCQVIQTALIILFMIWLSTK